LILFGFLSPSSKTKAMAAMPSVADVRAAGSGDTPIPRRDLDWFRREFYRSCTARADALRGASAGSAAVDAMKERGLRSS
jgi:hypothetical protein